jgi:hypothetical protein
MHDFHKPFSLCNVDALNVTRRRRVVKPVLATEPWMVTKCSSSPTSIPSTYFGFELMAHTEFGAGSDHRRVELLTLLAAAGGCLRSPFADRHR